MPITRWHLLLAGFLLLPIGFLLWVGFMRSCALARDATGRYCSADVTVDWLLWTPGWIHWLVVLAETSLYLGLLAGLLVGTFADSTRPRR